MHSIYDWFRRHRFAVDFVLMAVLWLVAMPLSVMDGGYSNSTSDVVVAGIFATALIVPLAWRRTRTVMAGIIVAVVAITQWALHVQPMPADIAVPLIVYALAAFGPRWASLGGLGLAMVGAVMLVTRYFYNLTSTSLADLPYGAVLILVVWVLVLFSWTAGDLTRTKRLREQALEDRAHRLEIEAQHERELAASDERAHIAREMHDIVAHSLSVIITQADGARYAAVANPDIAPATLATIAETGRSSLQEMRRLLGVLRGDAAASMRPLPGLADLDELLLGIRAAGLPVAYEVKGESRRPLPAGAELTAYRMVQEGLTNVMKHAGPKVMATVTLVWSARGLDVSVTDDGRGASASFADTGPIPVYDGGPSAVADPRDCGGNGLRGMAERVKLYDGTLTAGPVAGGGFAITAFIPYTET
ncbi:sensor histidine kinase [Arthrobacter glacialis]|uniref:histidine kinase n=1 Tax=Arthrobacter glacialis TaxID=1664 RepID=A0A2S4A087_ARTGL|nr:histidine kinase [Arthrobacter glacialis]POH59988.1 two-component sensor histidine kinase [Arthrobacter glacialis]POH74689.1 two-component sensor histidine kinase [Arthrobacter glacialis]